MKLKLYKLFDNAAVMILVVVFCIGILIYGLHKYERHMECKYADQHMRFLNGLSEEHKSQTWHVKRQLFLIARCGVNQGD